MQTAARPSPYTASPFTLLHKLLWLQNVCKDLPKWGWNGQGNTYFPFFFLFLFLFFVVKKTCFMPKTS